MELDLEQELERIATERMQGAQQEHQEELTIAPTSLEERAREQISAAATMRAVQDEGLVEEIVESKKQEIRQMASAQRIQGQAESRTAEIKLQEANYGVYSGVASYAGIKKPLPQYMQKIIFVFLSVLQGIFLIFLGSFTSVINIVAEQVDSVVKRLSSIAKSAKVLVLSLLALGFIALFAYVIVTLLKRYNIIV